VGPTFLDESQIATVTLAEFSVEASTGGATYTSQTATYQYHYATFRYQNLRKEENMSSSRGLTVPDIADRHRRYFAFAMLFVAVAYAAMAGEELSQGDVARAAEIVSTVAAVGVLLSIAPMMLWKLRNRSSNLRDLYIDADGFVADALGRAHTFSWGVTFVFMAVVATLDETLSDVAGFTLIYISVTLMAATFGASLLWLTRDHADEQHVESVDA